MDDLAGSATGDTALFFWLKCAAEWILDGIGFG
jgi:hypothetical protein